MNEELGQLDADLKGLFVENKMDEIRELLKEQPIMTVKEISDYNWNIIKKYYDTERFDLLLNHFKFVAYTCFIVEYAHRAGLISKEAFGIMMMIYNDILELKRQQRQQ
jgi:predicted P-loop ATPase